jgi:AcrR family transcriptional regulator
VLVAKSARTAKTVKSPPNESWPGPPKRSASPRSSAAGSARERILYTAYELFANNGIRAIGVDRIVAEAKVAKMTLYRHFASKQALVNACLELREQLWTFGWLEREMERRAPHPEESAIAAFDALHEWFTSPDFESCPFLRTLLEFPDVASPFHEAAVRHLEVVRGMLQAHAVKAGAADPEAASYTLQILIMGAILSASAGDDRAALRARELARVSIGTAAR